MTTYPQAKLVAIARRAMAEHGLEADPPGDALDEARRAAADDAPAAAAGARDLRDLLWSSIDNDESRDLDQIEWAERLDGGRVRLLIGVADVDSRVPRGGAVDRHAAANTTSVYTGVITFPMLPEALSTGATSLNEGHDRAALVIELVVEADGSVASSDVFTALVRNRAKLAYAGVGGWLAGGPAPPKVAASGDLAAQLRLQDEAARALGTRRFEQGALDLETVEARAVTGPGGELLGLEVERKNRARSLVEDLMVASNGAVARFLDSRGRSSIRRVVREPARWARLVALAAGFGTTLPEQADAKSLASFLEGRRRADPQGYVDLSLTVVKLLGPGEYALEQAGGAHEGHFGLAVSDYTHATAPNRRFADLVTQRLVKAALTGAPAPYDDATLTTIAAHCTRAANDAQKVERSMRKVLAARLLEPRVGERFEGVVTGSSPKGVYARLVSPPAEGRVVEGATGLDVGDRVAVRLVRVDVERGFIDFARA